MPRVFFEPIEEEIECEDDESVLDAAFRQGFSLVHGCREGQCSACKCYLLEGEVSLKRYSTFALSDTEEQQGYTLLCRAMPDSDLVVELLHVDLDDYRLENPIVEGRGTISAIEKVTHDIVRLEVQIEEPEEFGFLAGQYVDLLVPGGDGAKRSFSLSSLPDEGRLEFLIKQYPGGRLSGMLDGELSVGDPIEFVGPYGGFHLRPAERPIVMVAGGSGMAPELGLLRGIVASGGTKRPVRYFYGARTVDDLCCLDEVARLGEQIEDFRFVPVLSEPEDGTWDGETGFVHEVAGRLVKEEGLDDFDGYLCGPPPMVEAAIELFVDAHGIDENQLYYDKFTTSADAAGDE